MGNLSSAAGVKQIQYGQYTGDNTVNRAIPHGLNAIPQLIIIFTEGGTVSVIMEHRQEAKLLIIGTSKGDVSAMTAVAFYVGTAALAGNQLGMVYDWVAIA